MRRSVLVFVSLMLLANLGRGQPRAKLSDEVREFVKIDAAIVVLNHVRVIDGTGAAPRADQAIVIQAGKIVSPEALDANYLRSSSEIFSKSSS